MNLFRDLEEKTKGREKADEDSGGMCLFFFIIWFGQEMRTSHDWKQLWESLVGKPRGKATEPLIHAKVSVTLLLKLGRKGHVHAPTRDED